MFKASSSTSTSAALMFSADGKQPRAGTVARQLLDRKCDWDEFLTGMVLSCNPKAYVYKDIVNEEASLKELGSLFDLDYEIEEDRADLEDVQSSNEALQLARLADAEDAEMDIFVPNSRGNKAAANLRPIDFGTTYNEGAIDEDSEQMEAAVEEEEEEACCTKKRRKYSQKQLEFSE